MDPLGSTDFVNSFNGKFINRTRAKLEPKLAGLDLAACDLDNDGRVSSKAELEKLFRVLDRYDKNGDAGSVALETPDGKPTLVKNFIDALAPFIEEIPPPRIYADEALSRFLSTTPLPIENGQKGMKVAAVQYALARLGFIADSIDQSFGPNTQNAVKAFQLAKGLAATGAVDVETLAALDAALGALDAKAPAAKAADPYAYLSKLEQFPLSKIEVVDRQKPVNWAHPEIRTAYGKFVQEYWEVLKQNSVECDCKTLALLFMDQFRTKVKSDLAIQLPLPGTLKGKIPAQPWSWMTADSPKGMASRFEKMKKIRPGYASAQLVQKMDSQSSLVRGVNVRYPGVDANAVSRAAEKKSGFVGNNGNVKVAEVDLQSLVAGDIIFIDHTGDGKFDHVVNVVGTERNAAGQVTQVVLATASFDDMKDADGATAPNGLGDINNFCEEIVVNVKPGTNEILSSEIPYTSEPRYIKPPDYAPRTTVMELKPGGKLFVGCWSQPA